MARSRGKGYQWLESHVKLKWTTAGSSDSPYSDSVYIDTAQCLSLLNRKLVRQGQIFRIRNMRFFTNDTSPNATIKVGVIPRTWVSRNSWVKAKALWDKLNRQVTEDVGRRSIYPKWHDFKVFMDVNHFDEHGDGSTSDVNLLPVDFDDDAMQTGEWEYSEFSDSGATSNNYYASMMGDHVGSTGAWSLVGIITAYGESRTYPQIDQTSTGDLVPTALDTGPWARLFGDDDQTQDVISDLETKNDSPPYSRVHYIGGTDFDDGTCVGYTRMQTLSQTSGTATFSVPSFTAPCGLIRIEIDGESDTSSMQPVHVQFDVDILSRMDA